MAFFRALVVHAVSWAVALGVRPQTAFSEVPDPSSQTPCLHVMAFDRTDSLSRLLKQLNRLDYGTDSGSVRLTISVDYPGAEASGEVMQHRQETVAAANSFDFMHGPKVVRDHSSHIGLISQWLEAWTPDEDESDQRPACIFLEDDVVPSIHAWTWARGALAAYGDKLDKIASFGLQRPTLVPVHASSRGLGTMPPDNAGQPFLYKLMSSWGLVANRKQWIEFRKYMDQKYVPGHPEDILFQGLPMLPSEWHSQGPEHMWTYWFIRFMKERGLFTLYSNLGESTSLCVNMKEPGLHYLGATAAGPTSQLLQSGSAALHNFPDLASLSWYDWDAQLVAV